MSGEVLGQQSGGDSAFPEYERLKERRKRRDDLGGDAVYAYITQGPRQKLSMDMFIPMAVDRSIYSTCTLP